MGQVLFFSSRSSARAKVCSLTIALIMLGALLRNYRQRSFRKLSETSPEPSVF